MRLDATPLFLDRAREDAAELRVEVEYFHGDMRPRPGRTLASTGCSLGSPLSGDLMIDCLRAGEWSRSHTCKRAAQE
jgi:hypothetical protein